jgi:hypothetical protein
MMEAVAVILIGAGLVALVVLALIFAVGVTWFIMLSS